MVNKKLTYDLYPLIEQALIRNLEYKNILTNNKISMWENKKMEILEKEKYLDELIDGYERKTNALEKMIAMSKGVYYL